MPLENTPKTTIWEVFLSFHDISFCPAVFVQPNLHFVQPTFSSSNSSIQDFFFVKDRTKYGEYFDT